MEVFSRKVLIVLPDQCRFDHPGSRTTTTSSRNPFAPLQNSSQSKPRSNVGRGRQSFRHTPLYFRCSFFERRIVNQKP